MKQRKYIVLEEVLELHNNGYTPTEIAEKLNNDKGAMYRFYKRNNLTPNKKRKVKYTDVERSEIIQLYLSNKTIQEIQLSYPHLTEGQITYLLREEGITRRNGKRVYLNESYFEVIDTEDKAYFLGLLFADGSVQKIQKSDNGYSHTISLELNTEDRDVIAQFVKSIDTNLKVKDYHRVTDGRERNMSKITIHSKKIFEDLWNLGKRPMKVDTCVIVPDLPNDLVRHFIRGYFDGDGCIYSTSEMPRVTIYGTYDFLTSLKDEISKTININRLGVHQKKDTNVSMFSITKYDEIKDFYEYLYSNAKFYMKRRKEKFEECLFNK